MKFAFALAVLIAVSLGLAPKTLHAQSDWGVQDLSISWLNLNWRDLGVGGFDTSTDGWGTVGSGLDLGLTDPSLAGITMDIEVLQLDTDNASTNWSSSAGTALSTALLGGVQLNFNFSAPVAFRRVSSAGSVAFGLGEIETYSSDSLDYMEQAGNFNLVGGSSIDALVVSRIGRHFITAEDYNTTSFSVAWDDEVPAISTQALHFQLGTAVPEPSSAVILFGLLAFATTRRRRS